MANCMGHKLWSAQDVVNARRMNSVALANGVLIAFNEDGSVDDAQDIRGLTQLRTELRDAESMEEARAVVGDALTNQESPHAALLLAECVLRRRTL